MAIAVVRPLQAVFMHVRMQRNMQELVFLNSNPTSARHLSSVIPYQDSHPLNQLKNKVNDLVIWYEHFTGLDEVRVAQKRVLDAEEKFIKAQEKRREVTVELSDISAKLKELYAELDATTRGEDRYVHLITQEHKLLKQERAIQEKFQMVERQERDYFSALSSSVKESHEKERAQAERTKYWSVIGSIIGTVIGIIGTSINNHFRMKELKQLIVDSAAKRDVLDQVKIYIDQNSEKLDNYYSQLKSTNTVQVPQDPKVEDLLHKLSSKLASVEDSVKKSVENKNIPVQLVTNTEPELFVLPFTSLSESMQEEHKRTRLLLIGVAVISLLVPLLTRYS